MSNQCVEQPCNERIWYAVNRVTGRDMIAAGIAVLISSVVVFLLGPK